MSGKQPAGRTLLVSDIHGCYQTLRFLLEERWQITVYDELYLLGDYIDRGPASREVIDYVLALRSKGHAVHTLMGNHEDMMLEGMEDEEAFRNWLANGGTTTLKSFGVTYPSDLHEDYLRFFRGLDYYYELETAFLVHAGFDFTAPDPFTDYEAMLWIRNFPVNDARLKGKHLIHGHTPIPKEKIRRSIDKRDTAIDIDAGCAYGHIPGLGNLCGIDLNTFEPVFVENREL